MEITREQRSIGLILKDIFTYDEECNDDFNKLVESKSGYTFVGSKMYFELDDCRKVELAFSSSKENYRRYHAIRMNLINKSTGKIHESYTVMNELFAGIEEDHPSAILYEEDGWYAWDTIPTIEDKLILRKHVIDYINTWR